VRVHKRQPQTSEQSGTKVTLQTGYMGDTQVSEDESGVDGTIAPIKAGEQHLSAAVEQNAATFVRSLDVVQQPRIA
jgi:hypothetical protein